MNTSVLTVITAVAPYHLAVVEEAAASVRAQTVKTDHIIIIDHERRGAGWGRNAGLARVTTPFCTFLDADDILEPTFAERMLTAYDGAHYIYCDHYQDAEHVRTSDEAWTRGSWHVVTTLLPTAWVKHVGGFDETLIGGEDSDLYWKLRYFGMCGKRLPEPLMHYRGGGQRSKAFFGSPQFHEFQNLLETRYGGYRMSCCGENASAINVQASGAILVQALWAGNRQMRGAVTGTLYPRAGNGALMWVDARDVAYAPHLWQQVVETPKPPSRVELNDFQRMTADLLGIPTPRPPKPTAIPNASEEPVRPNITRVMELYRQATAHE